MKKHMKIGFVIIILTLVASPGLTGMDEYIFSVEVDTGGFLAKVPELSLTFAGKTPGEAFDKATAVIKSHKEKNLEIPIQIADIEAQIKALQAQKAKLEAQIGKEPEVYALVDTRFLHKYRSKLGILTTTTGIETKFGVEVYSVLFRPAPSIYGTPLIHRWQFHKWDSPK